MSPSPERALTLLQGVLPAEPAESTRFRVPGAGSLAVAFPSNEEEIAAVLRLASSENWGVIPAGHGGGLHIGRPPSRADVIVSTARMTGVHDYEPADLTLTARAGTRLGSLQSELAAHGQFLPLDPPDAAEATAGGMVAVGWSGSLKPGFGLPRDHVLGARAVLADGTATHSGGRVVKNVAGYDLHRLYAGSFGTLAVLTEISFKVRSLPAADETMFVTAEAWLPLFTFATGALAEAWPVAGCDLLSPALAVTTGAWNSPSPALALRTMGSAITAREILDRAASLAAGEGLRDLRRASGEESAIFWKGLTETETLAGDAITLRVVTAPGMLAAVLGEAQHALPASAALEFHAHAASGIARLFARGDGPALLPWIEAVRSRAAACGGHAIVERTPETLLDRVDVWGPPSGAATLARRIKETYDPKNILSPGRFADGL